MFGIDDATAIAVMPTPEAAGTPGFFTEGNPGLGQAATYLRASFLNALQTELLNILTAAGITPSKTTYDQLLKALRSNALVVATDTGVANAAVLTFTPAITALADGTVLWFEAKASNTGATTLNVNGLGARPVIGAGNAALQGGEITTGGKCQVVWHAFLNSWILIECTGGALQVSPATKSQHAVQLAQLIGSVASASSGYFKIPFIDQGGVKRDLIIQYGTQPGSVATGTVVTFPVAYPNALLGVFGNVTQNNATLTFVLTPSVLTLSSFILNKNYVGATQFGNSADPANWFSIGY